MNVSAESAVRPRVHATGAMPAAIEAAVAESFTVTDDPGEADGILVLINTRVDDAYLEAAGPQLRIVANYGVGVDNIDLAAAARRGVVVTNTPDVLTETTAELAITLALSLLRRVTEGDRFLRAKRPWGFGLEFMLGEGLGGKRFAVVGPGRIGHATARLAEAFGAEPLFAGRGELDAVLPQADIVSIHCPLTPETRHLIDARALSLMRASAVLVNTARGPIVDEHALVAALQRWQAGRCRARRLRARARSDGGTSLVRERGPLAAPRECNAGDPGGDGRVGGRCAPRAAARGTSAGEHRYSHVGSAP